MAHAPVNPSAAALLDADEGMAVTAADGRAAAQLWWSHVPTLAGERVGAIGRFEAGGPIAARDLLERACARLASAGCTLAVGPLDGTTWSSYRWVVERGSEPPFLFEPEHPPEYPEWWYAAGFATLASYHSTVTGDLAGRDPRLAGVRERLAAAGVTLRTLQLADFTAELERIYAVSVEAFPGNFLYSPISLSSFVAQYLPFRPHVDPRLVWIAEAAGRAVGYVFVVPDGAQARRGEAVTQVIVKTLAVRPGRAWAGLGALLLDRVHAAAHQLGYRRAIHALMHESNVSRNLSAHTATTIRRYALLSRRLRT